MGNTPLATQAKQSLETFQATLKGITDSQQRAADRSRLLAQGLTAIGGPARLTRTELDQVAKSVDRGLDAFRALGQKAPEELKKVSQAIKDQQSALSGKSGGFISNFFGDAGSEVTRIAAGFATGTAAVHLFERAASAVVGTITDVVARASHLADLKTSTKIGTDALQGLEFAGKRVGLTLDDIITPIDQLSKRIGTGESSAVSAVQSLGLKLNDLRGLKPEELFEKIGTTVARIADPIAQAGIASQLFGKNFEGVLRIASDGLAGNTAEAKKFGAVMSEDAIKTLDAFGDHVGDLELRFKTLAAEALTPVVTFLDHILHVSDELGNRKPIKFLDPEQQKLFEAQQRAFEKQQARQAEKPAPGKEGSPISFVGVPGLTLSGENAKSLAAGGGVITQADLIANKLKSLREAALEPLNASQRANISTLTKWGAAEKEIADLVGASEVRVHLYVAELKKSETEQAKFADAAAEVRSSLGGFGATLDRVPLELQAFANQLLDAGVAEGKVATFLHLTDTELNVIKQKRAQDAKLIELQAGANEGLAAALEKVGQKDVETIAHLKTKTELFDKLTQLEAPLKSFGNAPATPASILEGLGTKDVSTVGELEERFKKAAERAAEMKDALDVIVKDFALLAQIGGPAFGPILQGFASVIGGLKTAHDSFNKLTTSKTNFGKLAGAAGLVGAGLEIGSSIVNAIKQSLEHLELSRIGKDIGRDLGVSISDGTAQAIRDSEKKLAAAQIDALKRAGIPEAIAKVLSQSKSFRGVATALNLPAIIQDAGGIDAFGSGKAIGQLHDLFSLVDQGKLTVAQIGKEFDDVFSQLVPDAISKTSKLASESFTQLQETALRHGTKSPALEKFRSEQIGGVQGGLSSFFGDEKTAGTGKVQSQAAATGFGGAIAASFKELLREGVPLLDVIKQMAPTIEAFRKQLLKTGFDGGAAFDLILKDADLLKDKTAGPALASIQSLQQVLAGLANVAGLDAATFSGLTDQIGKTFQSLVAQGKDGNQILRLMAPTLQTIFELEERTGFAVDETTQNLINQAKAQGLVGDQFKSAGERTVDGLDRITVIIAAIANAFGVKLPKAIQDAVDKINKELAGIKDHINVDVDVHVKTPRAPKDDFPTNGDVLSGASTGGFVTPLGVQHFARGGRVLPFRRGGPDTVPAMLTPGEMILNATQQSSLAAALGSGGNVYNITIHATDADSVRRAIPEVSKLLREHIGGGGREQTAWQGSLRIA